MALSPLQELVGWRLYSVEFILNYIGFHFEVAGGGRLTFHALKPPVVVLSARTLTSEDPGYRDALCALIDSTVSSTEDLPEKLVIVLGKGSILVPLDGEAIRGRELATLSGSNLFNAWI